MKKRLFDDESEIVTIKRKRINEGDETKSDEMNLEIGSELCKDTWSKIVEFCDTREWLKLSYTCKGINQFKFNLSLMFNKKRTLVKMMERQAIRYFFRLSKGTLFNVDMGDPNVVDRKSVV